MKFPSPSYDLSSNQLRHKEYDPSSYYLSHREKDRWTGHDKLQVCLGAQLTLGRLKTTTRLSPIEFVFLCGGAMPISSRTLSGRVPGPGERVKRLHLRIIPVSSTHHHQSDRRRFGCKICDYCKSLDPSVGSNDKLSAVLLLSQRLILKTD